jgi:hypothetical protein
MQRGRPRGVIVHSDRGSQYCAKEYWALLSENGLHCSMSARGDRYDNAAMESWNHSLKLEAVHGERFITRAQAKKQLFDYIEVYYNRQRLYSTLGCEYRTDAMAAMIQFLPVSSPRLFGRIQYLLGTQRTRLIHALPLVGISMAAVPVHMWRDGRH